jgi:toxin-antitoxin system PIN domain toxin
VIIPDLNILLYAVNESSPRNALARDWLEDTLNHGREDLGLPWAVYLGFLRLTTNPRVFAQPLSVQAASEWLDNLTNHPSVSLLNPGKAHRGILRHLLLSVGTGGNLTTDAHLAALALENDAVFVTGDRDFLRFEGMRLKFLF